MMQKLLQWFHKLYIRIIYSIAFCPALIAWGHALTDVFARKPACDEALAYVDDEGWPRIVAKERSPAQIIYTSILPIWHYGRNGQPMQQALLRMVDQLSIIDKEKELAPALQLLHPEVIVQHNVSKPF